MKLFCVFSVGDGRLVATASRAPDLVRRELAAESGCSLIWCSVPPNGISAAALVEKFNLELVETLATATRPRQLVALTWIALLQPALATFRPKQRLRRVIRRLWSRTVRQT